MKKVYLGLYCVLGQWSMGYGAATGNLYPRSVFIPRQLSYMPILENEGILRDRTAEPWQFIFSAKPIYVQSVGSKFQRYFTINHQETLNVQEDGSGDIGSLWLNVISPDGTFYSSTLAFNPKRQKYGSMLYCAVDIGHHWQIAVNTALVAERHKLNATETNRQNLGTVDGYTTILESLENPARLYGKIYGVQHAVGLDDIQVKFLYSARKSDHSWVDIYVLLGIPTGKATKATYLFEPQVGSKHAQLGAGVDVRYDLVAKDTLSWTLLGEAKYRYAFKAHEMRSFDLTANGQWSRYMLLVNEDDKYLSFSAINDLTFRAQVEPRSSLDIYLASQVRVKKFHVEAGYDFWLRAEEKTTLNGVTLSAVGIADLLGMANLDPESASTANISQGVAAGPNQMVSDVAFVSLQTADINLRSGAAPRSISNTIYGSVGYHDDIYSHPVEAVLGASYEIGTNVNVPNAVSVWLNFNFLFNT